jgi:xanthine dehydrogenase YagS FAD-binding subunit
MQPFEHINAQTLAEAVSLLTAEDAGDARPIAGGTDLLTTLKAGLHAPDRLVNLKTVPHLDGVMEYAGSVHLGPLVTLDTLEREPLVREQFRALAEAAGLAASPQLRNMGTVGGNLAQETRCWYYRGPFNCWLKGGDTCYARGGANSHHAIFTDDSPCVSVHPSDPATALLALGADIVIEGASGQRTVPIEAFFTLPRPERRRLTALEPGDLIAGITIPPWPAGRTASTYLKAMDRALWSFALVGVAVCVTWAAGDGERRVVEEVRIALGSVAPIPRRAGAAEQVLRGQAITPERAAAAGQAAFAGARPLAENGYKLRLVSGLVERALLSL